eukprot:CAMPEP_0180659406 /NCGR_PEP_ID=MMETSP1037_2-20121125/57563_1 /TAXON_ID=632150 /ORGANISM="Azadinium spinosum, Strain 3D9" /LENGTH=52 /DNA_ID=CAMNT_0022686443 /DNA_START=141 /DNA_END=295 /DNA_ORIENTATION=+
MRPISERKAPSCDWKAISMLLVGLVTCSGVAMSYTFVSGTATEALLGLPEFR